MAARTVTVALATRAWSDTWLNEGHAVSYQPRKDPAVRVTPHASPMPRSRHRKAPSPWSTTNKLD